MTDLFKDKASEWDSCPMPMLISKGVGSALLATVKLDPAMMVLDFGAGTGLVCSHVAPHVKTVYAVDISSAMLEQLAAKPELADKVQTFCQDILETPLGKPVDLIISAMALHHVEDTAKLCTTFSEHLSSGGRIALADLDTEDGSFHPEEAEGVFHHGIDRDQLKNHLETSGFRDIEFTTALTAHKNDHQYPIFLVTATKA